MSQDPSSDLIFATKSGSTTPPDGPMPQPEQLKQKRKYKSINKKEKENKKDKKISAQQNSTSAKLGDCPKKCNSETKHQ
jgi:hypothetical protein